jgi:hypothetical protein
MGWHLVDGPAVGHWAASLLNSAYFEARSHAIGIERDGKLVAGIIYEQWTGKSITCHAAFPGRLTPGFLREIFNYPFVTCGVEKMIAPVSSTNSKIMKLLHNMGFAEEARITNAAADGDMVFYTLARQDCRFLK